MDPAVITQLFPAACTKALGKSNDGTTPFENGVGRIYYQMPIDEFVERQAQFEALVEDVLNTWLEPDDDDFEKCLKLYDYMESSYYYNYNFVEDLSDGAIYLAIMNGTGQCVELSGVYAYFLLQAGVEALQVGCTVPTMAHAWTYIVIDGEGYHSDPTWSLKTTLGSDELALYYFMMTGERRTDSGCPVDELQAPLLPRYFAVSSATEFPADSDKYSFPSASFLESIDEENKTVHYECFGEECVLSYGQN